MRMIQCGDGTGFALEALTKALRRDLDRDAAMKSRVGGAENPSHAALPERRLDPVRAEHGGQLAGVVRVDGRGRIVQRASPVARRHHLLDLLAQSGIGSGQESRAVSRALFDSGEEPLDMLPSLRCQGCLLSHDTALAGDLDIRRIAPGPAYPYCAKSRPNPEDALRVFRC